MNDDRNFITALARGLDVLACFGPRSTSLSLTTLARRAGLPKATVARIVYTLSELGYMRQSVETRHYSLGPAVLALGNPVLASLPIRQIAQPLMRELAVKCGGTVSLGVLDRDRVVYVETARSTPNPEHIPDIGRIWPILESAIGRALLAALPADHRARIVNTIEVREPDRWKRQKPLVERALKDFNRYGYCIALQEARAGYVGVAVALTQAYLGNRLAFNCAMSATDTDEETLRRKIAPLLVAMVEAVQRALRPAASGPGKPKPKEPKAQKAPKAASPRPATPRRTRPKPARP